VVAGKCEPLGYATHIPFTVNTAPVIIAEPIHQTVCEGITANISVVAMGDDLTYQWRKGDINLTDEGNISGTNLATLTFSAVNINNAADNYNVVVSGTCLPVAVSVKVSLGIRTLPRITMQPANAVACLGGAANFYVTASGTNITYQWRKGDVDITGANLDTYTINAVKFTDAAANYNVVVSGACAPDVTSNNVSLVISTVASIITQPVDKAVCTGSSVSFTVEAIGAGLTYHWKKGNVEIVDSNSPTFTINPVSPSDAAFYNVVVSNACTPDAVSLFVFLTVNNAPSIITQPMDYLGVQNSIASLSVIAAGDALTYQWRRGLVNLTNSGTTSGVNTDILRINSMNVLDTASNYNVVISGVCSPAITSNDASIRISGPVDIETNNATDETVEIYPNPFSTTLNMMINEVSSIEKCELRIYNVLGEVILHTPVTKQLTTVVTNNIPSGIYFYRLSIKDKTIQSGKIVSQQ